MIALGYNIYTSLMDFGNDPKCFVGWSNIVKWQFFVPLLIGAGVGQMKFESNYFNVYIVELSGNGHCNL